MNYMI